MRIHNPNDEALRSMPSTGVRGHVAGAALRWWEYGPQDAPTTVVLVHGFRGTHHGLLPVVARFADDPSVRFVAPDLPGFGASDALPREHTLDAYAAWLRGFLDQLDPDRRAVVLGHSFGSLVVARDAAALAPRLIVLVNPIAAPALEGTAVIGTKLAIFYYWLGSALPAPLGRALLRSRLITRVMSEVMAVTRSRALRAWIHREHDRHFSAFADRRTLLEAFRASVSDSVLRHADALPAGTVLVAGERDAIAPLDDQRRLVAAAPHVSLHVIEGVGHLTHYETPVAVARVLRAALAGAGHGAPASAPAEGPAS